MENLSLLIPKDINDFYLTLLLFAGLAAFLIFSELVHRSLRINEDAIRKAIHILTGVFIVFTGIYIENPFPIIAIALFFAVFNYITIKTGFIKGLSSRKHSMGTVYYPIAVTTLIVLFWEEYKILFVLPVLILAVADALAAVVGENVRSPHLFRIWGDSKSLEGSLTMLVITFLILYVGINIYLGKELIAQPLMAVWIIALVSGFYVTISEMIAVKGSDNLNVAIIAALSLKIFLFDGGDVQLNFLWAQLFALLAALISYRLRFLTAGGAVTAYFIAVIILGMGGWSWAVPILVFFILSSLLTKSGKKHKKVLEDIFEKGGTRDAQQVLANGGLATVWVILYYMTGTELLYPMFLASLAAATADTWATELGVYSRNARLITTFKPVEKGRSGGVSVIGTTGALLGSFVIALSAIPFLHLHNGMLSMTANVIFITIAGFCGSLIDSVMGATLQAQYQCTFCSKITEKRIHCGENTEHASGINFINNDLVNFSATISSALIVLIIYYSLTS